MNLKRTAMIVVCAALAAWFSAAMTPAWRPPAIQSAPPPAIDRNGAALAAEISRLRQRLRPDATPRDRVRNPFRFQSRSKTTQSGGSISTPAPTLAAPAEPPPVVLTLAGLAEEPGDNGLVRTAVISAAGMVFLVKEGETFSIQNVTYRVSTISEESAEVVDVDSGAVRRLALK